MFAGAASGSGSLTSAGEEAAFAGASADPAAVASFVDGAAGVSVATDGTEEPSPCFAAASISDDVTTTRLAGASFSDEAVDSDGLEFDFNGAGAETAATGFALAETDVFFPDFAEVFCRETAIASNLVLAGANAPISCCIAT
ncbi:MULTISPECIES: hypothetical protein [Thalassospira]|uniref:Uncharacterized protein n=2 Tax=Thalassospira TaxID=168934 RepID=A0A367W1Z4_9PROT|nr:MULTISPECIES: hypothetical protein [Thalassospira]MDG4721281.1 hypothetical protein [Thalassospira sp. FZY0004]RCK33620.1 hypothetical protein TH19_17070 [Thalassospira profundimaris]